MSMDVTPSVVPKDIYTDCVNGTILTYNGNEYIMLKDSGNVLISESSLGENYVPMGCKEYGNIMYVVAYNPITKTTKLGSIPSPNYDINPRSSGELINRFTTLTPDEIASGEFAPKMFKLFTFDEAALNPGDYYRIITDLLNIDNTKSVYNFTFWVLDESGKRHELKNPNILDNSDILKEYKPFFCNVKGILALEITEKELPFFEIACLLKFDPVNPAIECSYASEKINYDGNDILYLESVKIICTNTSNGTVREFTDTVNISDYSGDYLLKKFTIDNVEFGSNYNITVIPVTNYKIDIQHLRLASVLIKEKPDTGTDLNTVWAYYMEGNTFRLDFNIQVPELGVYDMFMEFYDPCQDYSIFFKKDSPNIFGSNTIFLNLKDEGDLGTPEKDIIISEDPNVLLSKNKRVRKDRLLKVGHLYIVRVSLINRDTNNILKFNKLLGTNSILNAQFRENPLQDFNQLALTVDKVDINITKSDETIKPLIVTDSSEGEFYTTRNQGRTCYYNISEEETAAKTGKLISNYTRSKQSTINTSVTIPKEVFGKFKNADTNISVQDESYIIDEVSGVTSTSSIQLENNIITNTLNTSRYILATSVKFSQSVLAEKNRYKISDRILGFGITLEAYTSMNPSSKPNALYNPILSSGYYKPLDSAGIIVRDSGASTKSPKHIIYKNKAGAWSYFNKGTNPLATQIDDEQVRAFMSQLNTNYGTTMSGFILSYLQHSECRYMLNTKAGSASTSDNLSALNDSYADRLLFIENSNGTLNLPTYYNFDLVKSILNSLGVVFNYSTTYFMLVYDDYEYQDASKTTLNCNAKINASVNTELVYYDKVSSADLPLTMANLLKHLVSGESITTNNSYLNYYTTGNITSYKNLDLGELEIQTTIKKDVLDGLRNSRTDFNEFESSKLQNTTLQDGAIVSFDGKHTDHIAKFTVTVKEYNDPVTGLTKYPVFKFVNEDLRRGVWQLSGSGNNEHAPDLTPNRID